jgi:cytochrome c oxidase assembly protein subunit 15
MGVVTGSRSAMITPRSRPVAIWLIGVAILVFAMVVVGGATRLTGSGLSITQWRPVSGALPPMSASAWKTDFALYRATPQYRLVNRGMSLGQFKFIYWWEWAHRLLGRLVGVAFAVPMVAFLLLRRMPGRLAWPCVGLFALGGLQGLVGWWMVRSGLEARVSVAPERLAIHLGLALGLLAALIWTALEAWSGPATATAPRRDRWPIAAATLAFAIFVQCLLGALVAGNQAGLVDADWPLMGGRVFPADYWRGSFWRSLVHGQAATQFDHRGLAYGILSAAVVLAVGAVRSSSTPRAVKILSVALALAVATQAMLGIATLRTGVPLALAILHQAGAAGVLALATVLAWRTRRQ